MTMGLVKYQWMMWQKGITDTLHNTFAFAFEVGFVKRYQNGQETIKMILIYLSGTKDKCLCLGGSYVLDIGYTIFHYLDVLIARNLIQGIIHLYLWEFPSIGDPTFKNNLVANYEACKEIIWHSHYARHFIATVLKFKNLIATMLKRVLVPSFALRFKRYS